MKLIGDIVRISPHSRIILIDIPDYGKTPYGKQTGNPKEIHEGIILYNTRIKSIAQKYELPVADVFTLSLLVETDSSLTTSDGLHPSGKQYALWIEKIVPIVEQTLSSL